MSDLFYPDREDLSDDEREPLTFEDIARASRSYADGPPDDAERALTLLLDEALPQLLAEVAYWRGLPAVVEYAVYDPCAPGCDHPAGLTHFHSDRQALRKADRDGGRAQMRMVYATPWTDIDDIPF